MQDKPNFETTNWEISLDVERYMNERTVVNCRTEREATAFLYFLKEHGIGWHTDNTNWKYYESDTCYLSSPRKGLAFGSAEYFARHDYQIIPFIDLISEITFEPSDMNLETLLFGE